MKKKILSMFFVIIMMILLIPNITVEAADTVIYVGGVELKNGQYVTNDTTTAVTGTPPETGYAFFQNHVLLLKDYHYSGTGDFYNSAAIYSTETFEIKLEGVNTLNNTSAYGYGLCGGAYVDIAISGTGSLDITGIGYDGINTGGAVSIDSDVSITSNASGIYADQVHIGSGSVNITANDEDAAINTVYDTKISGGSVTVYSKYGDGIVSEYGDVLITDANVNIEAYYYGIHADGDIAMKNCGKVAIEASDDCGIYAEDGIEITNCNDVEIRSVYEKGIRAKDIITISKSAVKVTSGEHGIYTANNDDAEIIIKEQSMVTIDAGDDGIRTEKEDSSVTISASTVNIINSDYGIYTKDDDSSVVIEESSNVSVSSRYYGVWVKDSSIRITGGVVTVTAQDEYGLYAKGSVTIDGSQTRVNITSTAADAAGIYYNGALYMDGGWLNNNGNHTLASDVTLRDAFTVDADRTLTIYPDVVLSMQAELTNNGTIANSGTLIIPTSADLSGSGSIEGGGTFQIEGHLDEEINVPEDLVYTGADLTDTAKARISLFASRVLQNATFVYINTDGWDLFVTPNPVEDAGDYYAVYTKGTNVLKKKFTVAKADGPAAPTVDGSHTNNGMTYTYTVNAIDNAQYSIDGHTWKDSNVFEDLAPGQQYTFYARIKETDNYKAGTVGNGGLISLSKLPGVGTVSIEGWIYGETAKNPVPASDTNGTDNVSYFYKIKDADDSTYKNAVPTKPGVYTVKASFAETATHEAAIAAADFTIKNIDALIDGINEENVKSTDREVILDVIGKADEFLEGDDLTDSEKLALEEIKKDAEKLIDIIEKAADAAETENIKKVENISSGNVTSKDKNDLEKAKADLEKALDENSDHYTEDEKKAIEEDLRRINDALAVIEKANAGEDIIGKQPETITKDDEERGKAVGTNNPKSGDNSSMTFWIALICISGGAVIALAPWGRKRRSAGKY